MIPIDNIPVNLTSNRTIVELKHRHRLRLHPRAAAFNRISVELKRFFPCSHEFKSITFNRTIVELKHGARCPRWVFF